MRYSIVGLLIILFSSQVFGQNNCEETLNAASEEFAAGRFYGIPAMLKPCLDKGFSREQRQRAYLLLTQTYLLLEDPVAAEASYLEVLNANPEFVTDPARDPIDLVYLSKKFTAAPIFSVYGKVGPTISVVRVIHDVDLATSSEPTRESYSLRPTIHAEIGADWHFYNRLSLSAAVNYTATSFRFREVNKYPVLTDQSGSDIEEMIERQNWFNIPISIKYSDDKGKFRPYGFLGYSMNLLLSDNAEFSIFNREPDDISKDETSPPINMMSKRNTLNGSFFIGGGIMLKNGLNYFFAEARYSFGLSNIVNANRLYTNDNGGTATDVFPYGHVDNYYRLDNAAISIGYVMPLYKPRKLKAAQTKGLLRFINKKRSDGQ